jgi:hypothetical protein
MQCGQLMKAGDQLLDGTGALTDDCFSLYADEVLLQDTCRCVF